MNLWQKRDQLLQFSLVIKIIKNNRQINREEKDEPLAKERSIIAFLKFDVTVNPHFSGTSNESKSTQHPPYTPKLYKRSPLAPPSSNLAVVWWYSGSTVKVARVTD
jgi:hypothetical protein